MKRSMESDHLPECPAQPMRFVSLTGRPLSNAPAVRIVVPRGTPIYFAGDVQKEIRREESSFLAKDKIR